MEVVVGRLDWDQAQAKLDREGYAILPRLLNEETISSLRGLLESTDSHPGAARVPGDPGHGERFLLSRQLPAPVAHLRDSLYEHLTPLANCWNAKLRDSRRYPGTLQAFVLQHRAAGRARPQSNLGRLREGDYQPVHGFSDDGYGFPLVLEALLSEPGREFRGGEFVLIEQRPRMQSRPLVVPLRKGDVAVIAAAQRPHQGAKGHYRAHLRHAISRVRSGERIGLELFFQDGDSA
jgi:hypothetical protein